MISELHAECCEMKSRHERLPWLWIITGAMFYLRISGRIRIPWVIVFLPVILWLSVLVGAILLFISGVHYINHQAYPLQHY